MHVSEKELAQPYLTITVKCSIYTLHSTRKFSNLFTSTLQCSQYCRLRQFPKDKLSLCLFALLLFFFFGGGGLLFFFSQKLFHA